MEASDVCEFVKDQEEQITQQSDEIDDLKEALSEKQRELGVESERVSKLLDLLDLTDHEAESEGVFNMDRTTFASFLAERRLSR